MSWPVYRCGSIPTESVERPTLPGGSVGFLGVLLKAGGEDRSGKQGSTCRSIEIGSGRGGGGGEHQGNDQLGGSHDGLGAWVAFFSVQTNTGWETGLGDRGRLRPDGRLSGFRWVGPLNPPCCLHSCPGCVRTRPSNPWSCRGPWTAAPCWVSALSTACASPQQPFSSSSCC